MTCPPWGRCRAVLSAVRRRRPADAVAGQAGEEARADVENATPSFKARLLQPERFTLELRLTARFGYDP